jgi:hypothetical protein
MVASVDGRLIDAAGSGLGGQEIQLKWGQSRQRAITAADGSFTLRVALGTDTPLGNLPATASYAGSSNGLYSGSSAGVRIAVRVPSSILMPLPPALQRGSNVLSGRLVQATDGEGIAGGQLHLKGFGFDTSEIASDSQGGFELPLPMDAMRRGGDIHLLLEYAGDEGHAATSQSLLLPFVAPTRLAATVPAEAGRGTQIHVPLALLEDYGEPVGGILTAHWLAGQKTVQTGPDGTGTLTLEVPAGTPLGMTKLLVGFGGDANHHPSDLRADIRVKGGAILTLDPLPSQVEPGQLLDIHARLATEDGNPLAGQLLSVHIRGQSVAVAVRTSVDGSASTQMTAPASGSLDVAVTFGGTAELAVSTASSESQVLVPAQRQGWPGWLPWAGAAFLALAAATAGFVLLRRRPRDLAAVLRQMEGRIRAGDPWAAGILLAYDELASHLGQLGVPERDDQSVRDFVRDIVGTLGLPAPLAIEFVQLVELARYGEGRRSEADAMRARRVLRDMIGSLRGVVAA